MFRNYFLSAFRSLSRSKFNTLLNIAGLAVSMACCIFVYALIRHENTFDQSLANADRIYRIVTDIRNAEGTNYEGASNFAIARALRNDFPGLEAVTQVYTEGRAIVSVTDAAGNRKMFEQKGLTYADPFFLKTFDHQLLAGSREGLLDDPDEVILTRTIADKLFGPAASADYGGLIGKPVTINKDTYRVAAVLADVPSNTNVPFKLLLPFMVFERKFPAVTANWSEVWGQSYTFVTLPEGQGPERLEAALPAFRDKYLDKEVRDQYSYHLQPLAKVHTDSRYEGTVYATPGILITAFVSMAIIVLVTACINFINLATAQSLKKAKEIGIRKTLGSGSAELVLRFMTETFLLVVVAAFAGLVLARQFISAFNDYLSFILELGLEIDGTVIWFLAGIILLTTLMAGYYPARVMSGFRPVQALKNPGKLGNAGAASKFSLRKALVTVQFAVTQLLIIGTIIVALQMKYFRSRDLGYDQAGMFLVHIPENDPRQMERFRNQLKALPEVKEVSFSSGPPTSANQTQSEFRLPSASPREVQYIERKYVDPEYLSAYRIKLLAGRNLRPADMITLNDSSRYNVLVNLRTVRALGFSSAEAALGARILVDKSQEATIAGVVDDFFNVPLQQEIRPCLMFYGTNWREVANIRFDPDRPVPETTLAAIGASWKKIWPDHIYKARTLGEYMQKEAFYVLEDMMFQAFRIFVAISMMIGCMGLYGLVSYMALQRQKEIGIRKVLGASVTEILSMFSGEFALLVGAGFILAAPAGYFAMNAWLQTFAYRINLDVSYFLAAFVISVLIAAITVGYQAVRAATANPVRSLRNE